MSRKVFPFLFVLIFIISQTGCLYGNIVDNKYTTTGVGNLTPVKSLTYYVGSSTYTWAGGYFANLTSNYYNIYNTNTNISRDGAGNMIFTDAVSGTKTLADLTVGSGGNVTGSGTLNQLTRWTSSSTIGSATNTDAQVSAAVTASHAQNTDTSLGVQAAGLNMGGNSITNVNLVDGVDVSTTVTGSGAATRLAYFNGAQSVADTNIYFDIPQGYYGIGTTTPDTMLQIHDGSGANQLQLSYTEGSLYTNITSNHMGYLLLNPSGDRAVLSGNLSMNTHYINDVVNPSLAQDAATKNYVDTAIAGIPASSGNVTTNGLTAGYIPVASSSTKIVNSIVLSNSTMVSVPMTTGAELCPTIAAANWTGGAGWTVGAGTLTRVASAVTTAYPTVAITPTVGSNYLLTFNITSWTAGSMTVTFGGVESTALQGNQYVYLYVTPYTTGNLIFTPTATFAGSIVSVSVKEYTGGEIYLEGGALYYDSRGHPNRLSHLTRHVNEMSTDTLLDRSRSTLSCSGGVLTYTLYAVYGQGTWNFNGVIYPAAVASANVTLTGGTDRVPVTNWVYFYLNGNTPTMAVSTTEPTVTPQILVAEFIVGAVSGSSYTIYGYNRARTEVDSFIKRVIGRFENTGSLYVEGSLPTVNATAISIASGGKWYQGIFEMTANNTVVAPTSFYYVFNNGTYVQATSLASMYWYADGTLLGANERQNIVWGIVPTSTTALGTLPTTVKLVAVLQSKPSSVYISATTAEQDVYEATNYYPPDAQLKEMFLPIARTILRPSTPAFETFGSGSYYRDLRGRVLYGGGAATSTDTSPFLLLDGSRPMTGNLNMGTYGNITMSAGMTVDGVDISAIAVGGNVTTAGGTANYIPKFTTLTNINNSSLSDDGTTVSTAENFKHTATDKYLGFATTNATNFPELLYETADANANALILALPDGGAVDVPVLVIGDQSIINKDLGHWNGQTNPVLAVYNSSESTRAWFQYDGIYSSNNINISAQGGAAGITFISRNNWSQKLFYDVTASNVPTLYGTGAYLRIGDAGVTTWALASEDDLMVSGTFEARGGIYSTDNIYLENNMALQVRNGDNYQLLFRARDNGVARVEVGKLSSAADPYFQIGRDDTGVSLNSVTDMLVLQAGAGTNNETANFGLGIPFKIGNAASEVEERGNIDLVLTTATNGGEYSKFNIGLMSAGVKVDPAISISANSTSVTLTPTGTLVFNGATNYGADAGASDTYTCTIAGITSYVEGMNIYFKANTANTGACTINVNSLGAKALKVKGNTADPGDNWILASQIVHCVYDGTNFQVLNPNSTP